ncbi:hypothetical protein TPAU25S_02258 [Tsukamurella paurometabola]|uniref:DUF2255 family protein n=1 Tax=Tsukamurella paurometabola (strain ATCC 8368 / DSM 20162 / CCUG 35730 / CIP 100753 / JCM 10117 / KCTC 9821 / NBRC 16120 / NCIMB 702349 / NCTC 13040) TaxID=521096 RepID=D5UTQ8_TSUPD|nr:DUF2255 family protein [Tsukamurella paurometabola]ADG77412.1 conserved hypothetical protein [Tsukamurella paurometabola DSM 20162]SUP26945.1 Uncharacterized protein conserved in bacteria (DUF2255) [Tsukamurella paurometabola]
MPLDTTLTDALGTTQEIEISSYRKDGTLRHWVPIWTVRVGDDIYIRSAFGVDGGWYKWAKIKGIGRVRIGGMEADVALIPDTTDDVQQQVDAGFETKYPNGGAATRTMVTEPARSATVRLAPAA